MIPKTARGPSSSTVLYPGGNLVPARRFDQLHSTDSVLHTAAAIEPTLLIKSTWLGGDGLSSVGS